MTADSLEWLGFLSHETWRQRHDQLVAVARLRSRQDRNADFRTDPESIGAIRQTIDEAELRAGHLMADGAMPVAFQFSSGAVYVADLLRIPPSGDHLQLDDGYIVISSALRDALSR